MSDVFIFKLTKILPYFAASNQHFTGTLLEVKVPSGTF